MHLLDLATTPLRSPVTYRRWVHLVLGGALLVPFLLAVLVVSTLLSADPTAAAQASVGARGAVAFVVAAVLGGASALVPGVAGYQDRLTRSLVGGPLADEPRATARTRRSRVRAAVWLTLHLMVGFAVSLATMIGLTEAALLALVPLVDEPVTMYTWSSWLSGDARSGLATWRGPVVGAALLVLLVLVVAAVGAAAARLAPVLLGPSAADRLAAAQARADQLVERNQVAAELHDAIGHALSVVALQAGAAARVIDEDQRFAKEALTAIAEQARTATAELDHVLGVLREDRTPTAPTGTLHQLPHLVAAARAAGADLSYDQIGPIDAVPAALSREAYRLCQEGITNALRHGDGTTPISVQLAVEASRLELRIENPAAASRRRTRAGGGHGLAQMAERIRLLGGELDAGPHDGTWRLDATLPLAGAS